MFTAGCGVLTREVGQAPHLVDLFGPGSATHEPKIKGRGSSALTLVGKNRSQQARPVGVTASNVLCSAWGLGPEGSERVTTTHGSSALIGDTQQGASRRPSRLQEERAASAPVVSAEHRKEFQSPSANLYSEAVKGVS